MLVKTAREAIEQDGAEVIILAGGMLAGYAGFLSATIGAPVLAVSYTHLRAHET